MSRVDIAVVLRLVDSLTAPIKKSSESLTNFDKVLRTVGVSAAKTSRKLVELAGASSALSKNIKESTVNLTKFATGATAASKSTGKLDTSIKLLASQSADLRKSFVSTLDTINSGTTSAVAEARTLAAEWRSVALSAASAGRALRGINLASAAAARAGGGHGGRGGGFHVSSIGAPLPGGLHARFRVGSNAALAGMGALAYGVMQESEVEDIAARAMLTGRMPVDANMTRTDAFQKLRKVIQRNASLGGYSPKEIGEALLGSERQFAGLDFAKRLDVLNVMLPAAMQEARFKETDLKDSAEAMIGLAHMTGVYDPKKLPELYRKFTYASMITPATLPEFTRALSYSMPSLVAGMGMSPDAVMFLTAMNQAAGIKSTKAGTWVQAFFGKLMPDIGVNLTRSQEKHNAALRKMGLLDGAGRVTWMVQGPDGKTDWMKSLLKLAPILGDALSKMPSTERLQMLDQVFGKLGGREAGLMNLKEFIAQFPVLAENMKNFTGGEDLLRQLSEGSPVQKWRQSWADLQNVLMDIGTVVLPTVNTALSTFDGLLKHVQPYLPTGGTQGSAVLNGSLVGGLVGGGLGWLIRRPRQGAALGALVGGAMGGGNFLSSASAAEAMPKANTTADDGVTGLPGYTPIDASIGSLIFWGQELKRMGDRFAGMSLLDRAKEVTGGTARDHLRNAMVWERLDLGLPSIARPIPYASSLMRPGGGAQAATSWIDSYVGTIRAATFSELPKPEGLEESGSMAGHSWADSFLEQVRSTISGAKVEAPAVEKPATAAPAIEQRPETHVHVGSVSIHVDGTGDPHHVADAVYDRFHRAVWRQLSDGQFSDLA